MNRVYKYLYSSLTFIVLFACSGFALQKPNIIIINMDDMGYGDTEPYGATGYATPNFNKLSKESMRFTHFYVPQAVCSPSRAALLTGCYPNRIGMSGGALMPWSKKALNPSEETIAFMLKKVGYNTAILGKWHLGARAPHLPLSYGFNYYYGVPYSNDMWPVHYDGNKITDTASWRMKFPILPVIENNLQVDSFSTLEQQAQLTTILTEKAVEYISQNKSKSFFLYLAHPMPHVPLAVSSKFKGKTTAGLFGDVMAELDWSLGKIMDALDKANLSKNTLLIVTSDNGPWLSFGNHAGSTAGLREGKGTAWDGGTRVPCFIRWPGKVPAATICNKLLTTMDILPTIAAVAKANLPKQKIDGFNFLPLLTGTATASPREVLYVYYDNNNLKLIRYKNWELVLPHKSQAYTLGTPGKDGFPGPTPMIDVAMALYNLTHDPGTVYDVQKKYPDVVAEILKLAEIAREDLGDDLTNRKGKNTRPAVVIN